MLILDAHAHLGHDAVFDDDATEEELLYWHRRCGVSGAVIQPFVERPYLEDTAAAHNRVAGLCAQFPGRFFGMASINPHLRPQDYDREAARCVRELGFVGIKLTPVAHAAHPSSRDGRHVFEVAAALGVPVMVHTGAGIPFADPAAVEGAAADFRSVPVVLAHAGTDLFFIQALSLARRYEHVYLEPSWLGILNLRKALHVVGPSKILFSSDHAINIPVELAKYTTLLKPGPALEQVMAGTAVEVFGLKDRMEVP